MIMLHWVDANSDEIGAFPEEYEDSDSEFPDILCPKCHKPCSYYEGMIDQTRMGDDIDGFWWACERCGIVSHATEL
jgi:hypothetical protein